MDNCDLEKLSVSGGKLHPAFKPEVTEYNMAVESSVNQVTLDLIASDCGASYSIVSNKNSITFFGLSLSHNVWPSFLLYLSSLVTVPAPLNWMMG